MFWLARAKIFDDVFLLLLFLCLLTEGCYFCACLLTEGTVDVLVGGGTIRNKPVGGVSLADCLVTRKRQTHVS